MKLRGPRTHVCSIIFLKPKPLKKPVLLPPAIMILLLLLLLLPSGFEGLTFILISFAYRLDFISILPADHYEAYPLWAHSGQRRRCGFGAVPSTRPLLIFSDDRRGLPGPFRSFGVGGWGLTFASIKRFHDAGMMCEGN